MSLTTFRMNSLGIVYVLATVIFGAIINYFTWSSDGEMTNLFLLLLLLVVVIFYLPLIIFVQHANWEYREFGFVFNGCTAIIAIPFFLLSIFLAITIKGDGSDLPTMALEVIARIGEELFFRGFVYALVIRILINRKKSHAQVWAVMLSSLAFTLVHTQTLLPECKDTMFAIFLLSLFLGFLRFLSGSILPGILLHVLFNTGNMVSVIFACIIFGLFVVWANKKGEDIEYSSAIT